MGSLCSLDLTWQTKILLQICEQILSLVLTQMVARVSYMVNVLSQPVYHEQDATQNQFLS